VIATKTAGELRIFSLYFADGTVYHLGIA